MKTLSVFGQPTPRPPVIVPSAPVPCPVARWRTKSGQQDLCVESRWGGLQAGGLGPGVESPVPGGEDQAGVADG